MSKSIKKIALVLSLVLLFFTISVTSFGKSIEPNSGQPEKMEIAQCVKTFLELDNEFLGYSTKDLTISDSYVQYYDLNDNIISYGVTINNKTNIVGYVIVGAYYDLPAVIEAGPGAPPYLDANNAKPILASIINSDEKVDEVKVLYGGPFTYGVKVDVKDTQNKTKKLFIELRSKELINEDSLEIFNKPSISDENKIKNNKQWEKLLKTKKIISYKQPKIGVVYAEQQPAPPTSGYTSISFALDSTDIQSQLGVYESCGCGPSAGALLFWHLAKRNTTYKRLTQNGMGVEQNIVWLASTLCGAAYMNPIGGTTVNEFKGGLNSWASSFPRSYSLSYPYKYKGTSLGSGQNGSNTDVWNNIKSGIDNKNAPVALAIGYKTTSGSTYYPESYARFEYHWIVVSGYIQDSDYNMYVKCKSWGSNYYASFNSMCYWRDALASVYVNEQY